MLILMDLVFEPDEGLENSASLPQSIFIDHAAFSIEHPHRTFGAFPVEWCILL